MTPYYERAGIAIYHGDCRDALDAVPAASCDLVLSDPPYGLTYTSTTRKGLRGDAQRQGLRLLRQAIGGIDRAIKEPAHVYLFCHWESWPDFYDTVGCHWNTKNALIWHKNQGGTGDTTGDYFHDYEMILFAHTGRRLLNGKRRGSVFAYPPVPGAQRHHPTEKPVALLAELIERSSAPGETVLDPFMGSGSTLVAAARAGRRGYGIEVEERYCAIAARRVDAALDGEASL